MSSRYATIFTACFFLTLLLLSSAFGSPTDAPTAQGARLKLLREDIHRATLPILKFLRKVEQGEGGHVQERVKVIRASAVIRETDILSSEALFTGRLNDEYPVLDKREHMYRVRLPDGREGWIEEAAVQKITVPAPAKQERAPAAHAQEILAFTAGILKQLNLKCDSAATLFSEIESKYQALSPQEKNIQSAAYRSAQEDKKSIDQDRNSANQFYAQYASKEQTERQSAGGILRSFHGVLVAEAGSSSYESDRKETSTARDISLSGGMDLSGQSVVTAMLHHRSTILQTPYTANDARFGYSYARQGSLNFGSFVSYNGYADRSAAFVDYNRIGAGGNVRYLAGKSVTLFGDLLYDNKMYADSTAQSYTGEHFNTGLRYAVNPRSDFSATLQGSMQTSKISALEFNRFLPALQYDNRDAGFGVRLEFETMKYGEKAKDYNYSRGQVDAHWSGGESESQIIFTAKQYENLKEADYLKLELRSRRQAADAFQSDRMESSLLYTHFPNNNGLVDDYLDLRFDYLRSNDLLLFNLNAFGRAWKEKRDIPIREHVVDLYSNIAVKFANIQIGPLAGAHILIKKDEKVLVRDGNSYRLGVDLTGSFNISVAAVRLSIRYERYFIYATKYPDIIDQRSTSLQIAGGVKVPLTRDIDAVIDWNQYAIDFSAYETSALIPIPNRKQFTLLVGLSYRLGSK